jgi:Ricin-type beta-trefoil lectin domain/Lysozyme like domain
MVSIARATIGFLCAAAVAIALTPAGPAAAGARGGRPASVSPRGAFNRVLGAAQASTAARTCARYATAAGWVNSAPSSVLVTATAICVAESGGQATVYYCAPTGQDGYYPPVKCSGLYDRGLWQLDSQAWMSISDACAFSPLCNADNAYLISQRGLSFTPWATYTSGIYLNYLDDAQTAVSALHTGTVPSGILGVCLSRRQYAAGAPAITARCASGAKQQWRIAGTSIRTGNLCLAAAPAARAAPVLLRRCAKSAAQQWTAQGNGEVRNPLAGRCLRDPGSSVSAGTPVNVGSCSTAKSRIWWLP